HDAELEHAVVRARVREHVDAAAEVTEVAEQDACRVALVQVAAVDRDLCGEALRAQVARPAPQVCRSADPLLEVVRAADHRPIEAGPGHDREALLLEAADVEPPAIAAKPD